MTEMRFFVYGSMSEGLVHFDKIKDFVRATSSAQIKGTVYRLKVGYPVVIEGGSDVIPGQLLTLAGTELLVHLLDEFHGYNSQNESKSLYFRKAVEVQTASGTESAWVYVLNPKKLPASAKVIEGGDWPSALQAEPLLTEKLSERQRAYVLRLGATSGREIVPIDLALYRELMNLEMIVDKGRRLALSKLGHEVYRYLT